jgi:hypothetical protein
MSTAESEPTDLVKVEIVEATALESLERAQVDIQIATAKQFPRSVVSFKREAAALACLDEQTAGECFYHLKRSGKVIEGPSVRFAEIVQYSWGNIQAGSRIIATEERFVVAQGVAFDMEKNVRATAEVKRRITDRHGKRYGDDMIGTTCNAACSIALRNAIFRVVPRALYKSVLDKAKRVSLGKDKSFDEQRRDSMVWWTEQGGTLQQIAEALGRKGMADITLDDLIVLRGLRTAIEEKQTTLADALKPQDAPGEQETKAAPSNLMERLDKQKGNEPDSAAAVSNGPELKEQDGTLFAEIPS